MRNTVRLSLLCFFLPLSTLPSCPAFGQGKPLRITVLPLKDRTTSGPSIRLGEQTADVIAAKLAETGTYTVVLRGSLSASNAGHSVKYDADFNPLDATRNGLPAAVDYVVLGQIDEFVASESSSDKSGMMGKKTELTGSSALKITLRVVATENGNVISTPSARSEKTVSFGKSKAINLNAPLPPPGPSIDPALLKLVNEEIDEVSVEVATKIAHTATGVISAPPAVPTPASISTANAMAPLLPKFVGMLDGEAVINKGLNGNVAIGQRYDILHVIDTGLIDPDTNKPIQKRRVVCRLVISSVDDSSSQGKCIGAGVPVKGDELREVMR